MKSDTHKQELKRLLGRKKGKTVWTKTTRLTRTGARVDLYIVRKGRIRCITYRAAHIIGVPANDHGLLIRGTGVCPKFQAVQLLSLALYGNVYNLTKANL